MAIGDAVVLLTDTTTQNYQPSSGVEVQITASIKDGATDAISWYNGSTAMILWSDDVQLSVSNADGQMKVGGDYYNSSIIITNSIYIRKQGTTDRLGLSGVITNV